MTIPPLTLPCWVIRKDNGLKSEDYHGCMYST
jgi:hypothetical protein